MSNIVTIAFTSEGVTGKRFLENIIRKTFEEVALKCEGEIEVFDLRYMQFNKKQGFVKDIAPIATDALNMGINKLSIHVDADDINDLTARKNKILPALKAVKIIPENKACYNIVAIIPEAMSKAWMLADRELF